jgi:hypothetical protein
MKKILAVLAFAILGVSVSAHAGQNVLLASAVRTATSTNDVTKTFAYCGVQAYLIVTAVPTVETLTFAIQGKDVSGNYYTLLTGTASATTGTVPLTLFRGATVTANVSANNCLPDVWALKVTHSASGNFTYSVVYNTID